MTAMIGGECLILATLEGDVQVILQSLTCEGMATALARREGHDDRTGITGGLFGGVDD